MTDQRPIDPSTLRDGDIVRAKRGEHGVVEGYWSGSHDSWRIADEPGRVALAFSHAGRWTITDILRPVLVKGDRVEWVGAPRKRKASTATVCQVNGDYVAVIRDDDVADEWPIEAVRRLPAAPEPAPIEVGDWLESLMDKDSHVVTSVDGDWIGIRWWQSGRIYRVNRRSIEWWTRLDGPPEPPVGSVYVIGKTVWHHHAVGHLPALMGMDYPLSWPEVQDFFRSAQDHLATLQIVHTLGVE